MQGKYLLRRATPEDEEVLLIWKNDPITRENSGDSRLVTPEEHHNWFTKRLQSDNVLLYIFCADGRPAGQGRLDLLGYTAEISYGLAPEFRGKGLGRKLLTQLIEKVVSDPQASEISVLYGQVKYTNVISKRLFSSLGFKEVMEPSKSGEMVLYKKVVR
ncbi:MAG: GNAT family N-acetyltransferase [Lachnospiraceae bacterium]|nr:GNAT family N-acetyltransferase [Lachnospiraceae bacterium]